MYRKPPKRYWRAYGMLYGESQPEQLALAPSGEAPQPKKRAVKPKVKAPTEQQEQFVAHAWLTKKNVIHHHSPNGGYRNPIEAAKFKRLGTSAGFPDLFIPYPRKGYHGLFIELKRVSGGKLSPEQVKWGEFLQRQGYAWYEAKGFADVEKIVKDYFT